MNFYVAMAFNFSAFIPGILAALRYKKINKAYHPFLYCLWIGCLTEVLVFFVVLKGHQSLMISNVYVFFESILLGWLLKNMGVLSQKGLVILIIACTAVWIGENFVFGTITKNSTYFRIFYSLALILLGINLINLVLSTNRGSLFTNSDFILCFAFLLYYTYKVMVQALAIYGFSGSRRFLLNIYTIMSYINLVTNLLYTLAVLWMPRKRKFSLAL